ncbi:MAG TPA: hypothetical protein PLK65_03440 [Candidatus Cloacimonas sp.]|jgi:hypothetical protein|nr:hypothetical protein [Candidatus Cloacimonas sp.]HQO46583.1 hypothetical protein [Candidatus Cloacimonas sp.]HQP32710.1 hypothetical protein [Candidatus Cloacimonas sp.]
MFRKLLFIILLILAACSTVKIPVEPQAKIDADNHFRYALQMETNRDFSAAKESYIFLFESYRSFADTKGMLDCLSGLARIELENENEKAYLQYKNQTAEIIQNIAPELSYYLLLLELYNYQLENNYSAISQLAINKLDYPDEVNLKLAIDKLQADSYLAIAEEKQVEELINLSKKIEKQQKKTKYNNPELLSSAWYALSYYYFRTADYKTANFYADKAQDWNYRFGNFPGMAHCLWLKAQISAAENNIPAAKSYWKMAEGIFSSLQDNVSLEELNHTRQKMLKEQNK